MTTFDDEHNARPYTCQVCGERFDATRRDAETCSGRCRQKRWRDSRRVTERGTSAQPAGHRTHRHTPDPHGGRSTTSSVAPPSGH